MRLAIDLASFAGCVAESRVEQLRRAAKELQMHAGAAHIQRSLTPRILLAGEASP